MYQWLRTWNSWRAKHYIWEIWYACSQVANATSLLFFWEWLRTPVAENCLMRVIRAHEKAFTECNIVRPRNTWLFFHERIRVYSVEFFWHVTDSVLWVVIVSIEIHGKVDMWMKVRMCFSRRTLNQVSVFYPVRRIGSLRILHLARRGSLHTKRIHERILNIF